MMASVEKEDMKISVRRNVVERQIYCRGSRVEDGKKRWTSWKKKKKKQTIKERQTRGR